jgi:hypothetical protein
MGALEEIVLAHVEAGKSTSSATVNDCAVQMFAVFSTWLLSINNLAYRTPKERCVLLLCFPLLCAPMQTCLTLACHGPVGMNNAGA